jgi:hypothetical protein
MRSPVSKECANRETAAFSVEAMIPRIAARKGTRVQRVTDASSRRDELAGRRLTRSPSERRRVRGTQENRGVSGWLGSCAVFDGPRRRARRVPLE